MRSIFLVLTLLLSNCTTNTEGNTATSNIAIGDNFIDAFYSFDRDSLKIILSSAENSQPEILYYQKWAECAHYKIVRRSEKIITNDSTILIPITVKDDLMAALAIDFNVTDTFHLSFQKGKIHSVKTSSNDPVEYHEAKEWVNQNRPEWVKKNCEGIWAGGPTPCECAKGMLKGFAELTELKKTN
jgi:hypothetical protein